MLPSAKPRPPPPPLPPPPPPLPPPKRQGRSSNNPTSSSPSKGIAEVAFRTSDELSINATDCVRRRNAVSVPERVIARYGHLACRCWEANDQAVSGAQSGNYSAFSKGMDWVLGRARDEGFSVSFYMASVVIL